MGWGDFVDGLANAADQTERFGGSFLGGAKEGLVSLAGGVKDLAVGGYKVVTDAKARNAALDKATELARTARDYGGRLIDDPASREQAWDKVQAFVGGAKDRYLSERAAAENAGRLPEFYGHLAGRGGFEVGTIVVPATKLGKLGKLGSTAETAADLKRAEAIGASLPRAKAGETVVACAVDAKAGAGAAAANGATRTLPLGFESEAQFAAASKELQEALLASGVTDAQVGVRGSSVTGQSFARGTPFGPGSDIDFFAESAQLTDSFKTSKSIPGFVHPSKLAGDFPAIEDWADRWSALLGRKVSLGGFVPGTLPTQPAILVK